LVLVLDCPQGELTTPLWAAALPPPMSDCTRGHLTSASVASCGFPFALPDPRSVWPPPLPDWPPPPLGSPPPPPDWPPPPPDSPRQALAGPPPPTGVVLPAVWRRSCMPLGQARRPRPPALVAATPFCPHGALLSTTEPA